MSISPKTRSKKCKKSEKVVGKSVEKFKKSLEKV